MARPQSVVEPDIFGGAVEPAAEEKTITMSASELRALIAEQVAAAMAVGSGKGSTDDIKSVFQEMALSIAEMSHQGDRTYKPVDPRVLAARKAGQDKLDGLLAEVRENRKVARDQSYSSEAEREDAVLAVSPRYRALSVVVLEENLIQPYKQDPATKKSIPVEFYWCGEPNDAMIPLNDVAREIHMAFCESRGSRSKIEKRMHKPVWMTEMGLVIEGAKMPARRGVEENMTPVRDSFLDIPGNQNPDAEFVQVLGNHPPFARNFQGRT